MAIFPLISRTIGVSRNEEINNTYTRRTLRLNPTFINTAKIDKNQPINYHEIKIKKNN
jgi:hypothetical protein